MTMKTTIDGAVPVAGIAVAGLVTGTRGNEGISMDSLREMIGQTRARNVAGDRPH